MINSDTPDILKEIVQVKKERLDVRKKDLPIASLEGLIPERKRPLNFSGCLMGDSVRIIAEVKRGSPSKGIFSKAIKTAELAKIYAENGAAAVSILTNEDFFYGSIDDLLKVGDKWIITDKKTTGSIGYFSKASSKPSDSHKDQINRYRVLLHKCYGINADFGCVIYISNSISKEVRDKPACLSFKLQPYEEIVEDMKQKAAIIKDALLNKTLPKRTKCFLCDGMCPYATKCFTDDRKLWDEE